MTSCASYDAAWRASAIGHDLWRVRNAKPLWSKLGTIAGVALGGFDMWTNTLGFSLIGTLGTASRISRRSSRPPMPADRLPETGRQAHLRPAVVGLSVEHQSRGRSAAAPHRARCRPAEILRARRLCRAVGALLPGRRLRMGRGGGQAALRDQRAELRPLQDLRHQRSEPEHHLGAARGWRRTELSKYVIRRRATRPRRAGTLELPRFRLPCGLSVLAGACAKGSFSRPRALRGAEFPVCPTFLDRQWTIQTRRWRYRDQHAAAAPRRLCRRRHAVRAAIRARDGNTDDTGPRACDRLGQLSRGPACRHRARFGDRGRLLPQRVEVRSAQCGAAQPHLPLRAHRRRYRGGRPPGRSSGAGRPQRSDRAACARRARAQAEAICAGTAEFRAIDPRSGHRSHRHAAARHGPMPAPAIRMRRSTRSTSSPARTGTRSSRTCMPL